MTKDERMTRDAASVRHSSFPPAATAAAPHLPLGTARAAAYFPAMIHVTDAAFAQLEILVREQTDPANGLRILVENGGCAGLQYAMGLDHAKDGDEVVERAGAKVIIDAERAHFLAGSTIDYVDDLAGSGFRIQNPNAARSCGCGTSFEPADAEAETHQH